MSLARRVSEIADAYEHSNLSTARLLAETGYMDGPHQLTVPEVEAALEDEPKLAELWLERGMDQRVAGGWGIEHDRDHYRVQNYSNGQYFEERDRVHACAEFIVRYVGFIRDTVKRPDR